MEGVILFADDHIFEGGRFENDLFQEFNKDGGFSILPINNLSLLQRTVSSISTYKAIILDWNFNRDSGEEGVKIPDDIPFEFLKNNKIYSLIYVYSQAEIEAEIKAELLLLYPNKIFFETKNTDNTLGVEYAKIVAGIKKFEDDNGHLKVPYLWSRTINNSVQGIFEELEKADKYWIKDLYYTSVRKVDKATGVPKEVEVEPTIEVITLFQNLLSEKLIQSTALKTGIEEYSKANFGQQPDEKALKELYSRLYYTNTNDTDTVMTGDVYEISEGVFGIVISPECDMSKLIKKNENIELLAFAKDDFAKIKDFCKTDEEIARAYNQEIAAVHLLPVFPINETTSVTALIDFRYGLKVVEGKFLEENKAKRKRKINSPYIQQLRQRYLSYVGRVGVPAIPNSLRVTK